MTAPLFLSAGYLVVKWKEMKRANSTERGRDDSPRCRLAKIGYYFLGFFDGFFFVSLLMSLLPLAAINKSSLWDLG